MWVREHGKSASQHYHVCVFLDQKKCNSYYGVYMDAVRLWECALDFGKVSEVKNGCLFAKDFDFDAIQTMVLRLSYFAKMKTKNPSYDGIKRFHSDHTF